jgi:3-dehydroquinate synthase
MTHGAEHTPVSNRQVRPICDARLHDGRSYGVFLVADLLHADHVLGPLLGHRRALLVAPAEVWALYGPRVEALCARLRLDLRVLVLELDEARKTLDTVVRICASCHENHIGRTDVLLALGGGVCCDLVTVAAGLVRRGIAYVRIPTTLIGQIDAGIGIKGGLNFDGAKSYLGVFKPPEVVLIDPAFLVTSPLPSLLDGLAETVKVALIADPHLFELVERHGARLLASRFAGPTALVEELVSRAAANMVALLQPNFFEDRTYRREVDLGHTFSGLIEARSGYTTSHGQAVAIDLALSSAIAVQLGLTTAPLSERIVELLRLTGLPVDSPLLTVELCEDAVASACLHRGGAPNLVVPRAVGSCDFVADRTLLTRSVFEAAIASLRLPHARHRLSTG